MARIYRYKDMQLAQLRGFCLAARERNFTAAARQLGLSASTVWEQLRALERTLGCSLLYRQGRAIELTVEGQLLLDLVQPHIEALDSLKRLFDAGRAQLAPHLVIASSQYLLRFHLPEPIQEFTSTYPKVQLKIQLPSAQHQASIVEDRAADIAICAFEPEEPRSEVLTYEPLLELPLQMLISRNHPLARKKVVTLQDLLKHPVILPAEGAISRRLIDRLLVKHDLAGRLQVVMEAPMFDTTQQYVEMGVGVGLMHIQVPRKTLANIQLRPIAESQAPLMIAMVTRKHGKHPEEILQFQEIVRRSLSGTK
ncbi:LysR family transcriptional regulator [bacterium]|nr:LysR family transcriptional regulator [bacterium]